MWVRTEAAKIATQLLGGVGIEPSRLEYLKTACHFRRSLSGDEMRRIDQVWLAIPPIDMG